MKKSIISLQLVCLLLIFLWGVWLRTAFVDKHIDWKADNSRDVLVAKHLVVYGQSLDRGPYMAGLRDNFEGVFRNSPTYYQFLAGIFFFFSSAESLHIAIGVLGAFTIIFAFLLGRELKSTELGLIMAILVANCYFLVLQARTIWQPFVLPFFITLSLYGLLLYKKNRQLCLE